MKVLNIRHNMVSKRIWAFQAQIRLPAMRARSPRRLLRLYPAWLPYMLLIPALSVLSLGLFAFLIAIYFAMTNFRLIMPSYQFVGLQNFLILLHDHGFRAALWRTFWFTGALLAVQLPLGMGIALLLQQIRVGVAIWRTFLIIPLTLPPIISGLMWKTMLAPYGPVNYLLRPFGFTDLAWLGDQNTALIAIFFIELWISLPFVVLVLLAGLQALPAEPFEAAAIDGAGPWPMFRYITLPLLRPYIYLVLIFRFIDNLKIFDTIMSTTRGGPGTSTQLIQVFIYDEAFKNKNLAIALAGILIVWLLTWIVTQLMFRKWFNLENNK
jgi:multiple sugar transport system permease protein